MTANAFENLPKQSPFLNMGAGQYKVYKDSKEFVTVVAASALEAIKSSGCEQVYRIERDSLDKNYILDSTKAADLFLKKEQPAQAAAVPVAAAEAPKA